MDGFFFLLSVVIIERSKDEEASLVKVFFITTEEGNKNHCEWLQNLSVLKLYFISNYVV